MRRDSTIIKEVEKSYWNEEFRKAISEDRLTVETSHWVDTVRNMMKIALGKLRNEFHFSGDDE